MLFSKIISTFFGIGYIGRGAGTVAAFITCMLLYLGMALQLNSVSLLPAFVIISMIAGVYTAGQVEKSWGKDSKRVVIDEVLGMAVTMLFLPINLFSLVAGFLLFRFFDIVKPLGIRKTEQLKGGWGVMMDDLLAGIYSNIALQLLIYVIANYYENIF